MSDTTTVQVTRPSPRVARSDRSPRLAGALGALLLLLSALPGWTAAEPTPLDARVVWVRGSYAYVAAADSLAIAPFSRLTFTLKSKPVATARVEGSVEGGMIVARITAGSLARVKRLDRLGIIAETPDRPRLLRLGFPTAGRSNLSLAPDSLVILTPMILALEGRAPTLRLIRRSDSPGIEGWPDTLLVRGFVDPTDQEIALERGELDAALFLPGELSTRMREHPRWKERLSWPPESAYVQIVCRPELLPYLRDLGPRVLASLLPYAGRRP